MRNVFISKPGKYEYKSITFSEHSERIRDKSYKGKCLNNIYSNVLLYSFS
jgi:hypothetical protein